MKINCLYDKLVPVTELKPHPKNSNKHPEDQITRLAQILEYQGWRYPIKVSKLSGFVTSGHGRLEAAKKNGWNEVPVNFQEYESEAQEYADLVADNSIALWSELDLAAINADLSEYPDLNIDLLGIEGFGITAIKEIEPGCDEDEIPDVQGSFVKPGDLFILGDHRLLCGDSTNIQHVEKLMNGENADMVFTDPPYGMNLDTKYSKLGWKGTLPSHKGRDYKAVIGDNQEFDPGIILGFFEYCHEVFLWGADHYYWNLPKDGSWIIWDKRRSDNFEVKETVDNIFGSHFEACWSKQKHRREIYRIYRVFGASEGKGEERHKGGTAIHYHPTQKPTALFERVTETIKALNIVDLFGGSGSTLIACEKTNRKCFMMEIDPHYCTVIIDRWEKYSNKKAIRDDGKTWSEIKQNG